MSRTIALFTGSRRWTDEETVRADIRSLPADAIVIHGCAPGLDRMAGVIALANGLHVAEVAAQWAYLGDRAGPERNKAMLALGPTVAYAYPLGQSRGTRGMIALLLEAGVPTFVTEGE